MKTKRILLMTVMLALMTAFCMFASINASAETSIDDIEILGVPKDILGQQASTSSIRVPDGAYYSIKEAKWTTIKSEYYTPVSFNGTFANGNWYVLFITIEANDGFVFAHDGYIPTIINGTEQLPYSEDSTRIVYGISYKYLPRLETVNFSYTLPKLGQNLKDLVINVPSDANYTVKAEWSKYGQLDAEQIEPTDNYIITAGHKFYLSFCIEPKFGYAFDDNTQLIINGTSRSHYAIDYSTEIFLRSYSETIYFCKEIEALSITPPILECGGEFGSFTLVSPSQENIEYYIRFVSWTYNKTNDFSTSKGCSAPIEGGYYWAKLTIDKTNEYCFTKDTVITVNGKTISFTTDALGFTEIVVPFEPIVDTRETIKSLDIKLPTPRIGDTVEIFAPYRNNTNNAKYATFRDLMLVQAEVDDIFKMTEFTDQDTFKKGMYYFIGIELEAVKGYKFSQDTVITMNGQQQLVLENVMDENTSTRYLALFRLGKLGEESEDGVTNPADTTTVIPNDTEAPDENITANTGDSQNGDTAPGESTNESTVPDDPSSADTTVPADTAAPEETTQIPVDTDTDSSKSNGNTTKAVIIAVIAIAIVTAAGLGIFIFRKRIFPKIK